MFTHFDAESPAALRARLESSKLPDSIYDLLLQTAASHGEAPAWNFIDSGVKRNWREVLEGVETAAAALASIVVAFAACDGPSEPAKDQKSGAKSVGTMADSGRDKPEKGLDSTFVHEALPAPTFRFEDVTAASGIVAISRP